MNRSFYFASMVICLVYGMVAQKYQWFPSPQLHFMVKQAKLALGEVSGRNDWYYVDAKDRKLVEHYAPAKVQPGLTLVTGIGEDHQLGIKVIDFDGAVVHQWLVDWYDIWPDATHVPEHLIPKGKPGTHIHGSRLMDNGDIVFNFENIGLIRLDACANVVFKKPFLSHHSINVDDNGDFWLPTQVFHDKKLKAFPNVKPQFKDDTISHISKDGELISQVSVMQLLHDNGYDGLLYMSTLSSRKPKVSGDVFHLNDVEVFPGHLAEGVFKHGDVMVSLRNNNTVFVYDPKTLKIRYLTSGKFVRQHDPDFIDGNSFSVYDNNHIASKDFGHNSKIVIVSALDDSVTSYLEDDDNLPFFSNIMGKHQWLDNGNLLIVESMNGRTFEVTPDKQRVWQYNNLIAQKGLAGIMEGSQRLNRQFDRAFFEAQTAKCQSR
jgi:hypothetical protein